MRHPVSTELQICFELLDEVFTGAIGISDGFKDLLYFSLFKLLIESELFVLPFKDFYRFLSYNEEVEANIQRNYC